ncbi:MAG: META domain-containing protein [Burkholderiales bacterium]|nr:META domain-containing protein [Burkholderiales bacterium]MDE2288142.1 META domain-containing protein [Burkholderiales bacterium]MDE2609834.1 META domain-containing protein [Burkholderiales bacterium]
MTKKNAFTSAARLLAASSIVLGSFVGCAATPIAPHANGAVEPSANTTAGLTGRWVLLSWTGQHASLPSAARNVTLALSKDGAYSGSGGCNRIFGQYHVGPAHQQINLNTPSTTRMSCPVDVMAFESRFLATLAHVDRFELTDDTLVLFVRDTDRLTFARQVIPKQGTLADDTRGKSIASGRAPA